jgi:hypothetical protein
MSNKAPKRKKTRAIDRRLKKEEEHRTPRRIKLGIEIIGLLIGIPSLVVAVLALLPRFSISPQSPLISLNAFSAPFLVSNDAFLPVYKVNATCSPKLVTYIEPGHPKHRLDLTQPGSDEDETGGLVNPDLEAKELLADHKLAFPCALLNLPVAEWVTSAHILMTVTYHTPFLPFIPRYHRQRFELTRDSSGQWHWIEEKSN